MSEATLVKRYQNYAGPVQGLFDWCIQENVDMEAANITTAHIQYLSPQTPEEKQRSDEWAAKQAVRIEEGERRALARLLEKYGRDAS